MKLKIERRKWLRGEGRGVLYRPNDGRMCCLGFYCKAKGFSKTEMEGLSSPEELTYDSALDSKRIKKIEALLEKTPEGYYSDYIDNEICRSLVDINDDEKRSDTVREKMIKTRFKKIGVDVEFH